MSDEKPPSTGRLEAFSDGVIAVIITIMVLELKVPHQNGLAGLYSVFATLLIYLLSFAFTAIYWINHEHLVGRLHAADRSILYANLGFLFCLSLLPFFTAYVVEKEIDSFAVSVYAVSMNATAWAFFLFRIAVHRSLRRAGSLDKQDRAELGKHLASLAAYGVAIPLAYLKPIFALLLIAIVTVIWTVPRFAIRKA